MAETRLVKPREIPSHEATLRHVSSLGILFCVTSWGLALGLCLGSSEEWPCSLTTLCGISADKRWERVSLPAPTRAGDIQDASEESDIVTAVEEDTFLLLPCHYLTFIKKVKLPAGAISYATSNLKVCKCTCRRGTASRPALLPGCSCRFEGVPPPGNCMTTPLDKLMSVRCNLRLSHKYLSLPSFHVVEIDRTCISLAYKAVKRKQMKMNKPNCALLSPLSTYFACTLSIAKRQLFQWFYR